jgi:Ca-activated chloride channel family protein
MEIQARFTHDKLDHSQDNTTHLVVSLQAPALDWVAKRPKVCVLPVIDLSGSMRGDKLAYAKKSAHKLVEHLQPGDVAGLAMFHDFARVIVEPAEVTAEHKDKLHQAIEKLHIGGGTNFADGLVQAVKVIQQLDLAPSYLHRVIMFTDGQPTIGITDNQAILKMLKGCRSRATVSAFGYGDEGGGVWNGCDQNFLGELATLGEGNYAYVKDPDDALAAFGKELGGLLSTYATNLIVEVEPAGGHQIKKVVTDIEHEEDVTGKVEIPISTILSEEARHLVFEVALAKQKNAFPRQSTVVSVRLSYATLTEGGSREAQSVTAKGQLRFVKPDEAQSEPHKDVDQIVALHQTIRAQLEAEKEADQGNYEIAAQYMEDIGVQIAARGHEGVAGAAKQMCFYMADAQQYTSNAGARRGFARGGTRSYGVSHMDHQTSVALADCNVSLSNSAQDQMGAAFTVGEGNAGTVVPDAPATSSDISISSDNE